MKRTLLFTFILASVLSVQAQKKSEKITAYAITGVQKGSSNWTEVRLVDVTTGDEVQTVYSSATEAEILNARTGKPVTKRDVATKFTGSNTPTLEPVTQIIKKEGGNTIIISRRISSAKASYDQPFATNSAACAYDKKHNRLYYTPMGIAQLRYIDLKAKSPKFFYFEDEPFGVVKSRSDAASQITRMVIAADGKGYALSNDANHLIQFATKKKQEIIDLGPLTDDGANGRFSVHSSGCYGGDIIADKENNIYLVGANRTVFKISLETKVATYLGAIKNLPRGFSTNGAIAEGDSKVIVSSSNSTQGYYRFDLNTLEAEKISTGSSVFNASDLASAALAFEKKEKKKEKPKEAVDATVLNDVAAAAMPGKTAQQIISNAISVYPNPVTDGYFKLSFSDQAPGRYQIQLMDAAGKVISTQSVNINNKVQVEEFRVPQQVAAGNYLVRVINERGNFSVVNKIVIQ